MIPSGRGKFITLEGIDGAGKSTHLGWVAERIRAAGFEVVLTREPGGTPLGEKLREIVLAEPMHIETEALLMFASRREHLDRVILPALNSGRWVVCDRFTDATFAYQGAGRGLDREKLLVLEEWVQAGIQPDLTIFFDLPVAVARQRLAAGSTSLDRFEREKPGFFERVRNGYLQRASADPSRMRVVDANRSIDDIKIELEQIVTTICIK